MSCCLELFQTFSIIVVCIQLIFGVFPWIYGNVVGPFFSSRKIFVHTETGHLAKRGLNVILVARTISKLESVANEISETFKVETQVVAVNFTSGPEIYDQIKQQIIGKEIGVLVNNVGMFYPTPDFFLNIPDGEKLIQDIVRCNITSIPMMCNLILPQMVQRKRGLIINVSSMASVIPGPAMIIYSASKAFVTKFSADLGAEYEAQGIDVQVLITGSVSTKMNKVEGGFTVPTASQYVESALRTVGYARHTNGFLPHSLVQFGCQFINFTAPTFIEGLVKKEMLARRDKEIKIGSYVSAK